MDLRLELRRTSKLVVASPKGDSVSVPGTPVPGSGFFRPYRDYLRNGFVAGLVVASAKGDSVPWVCFPGTPVPGSGFFRPYRN
jgi:hypothetical protein